MRGARQPDPLQAASLGPAAQRGDSGTARTRDREQKSLGELLRAAPGVARTPQRSLLRNLEPKSADLGPTLLTRPGQPTLTRVPPPILPRPSQQTGSSSVNTFRPAYSSFSSGYGAYGNSFYGSYSPYSYGYNGLGFNRLRVDDLPPSRFVQQAEESSRGAFQSIESIVHAFASVSMMMDATFSAVYNSFRAVLDVANHFSRLKIHFTKVFSAFALVRTIRYLYRRLQWMMGFRRGSESEDLWEESERTVARLGAEDQAANSAKSWPIFLFFAVILGGPYLIWKLLSVHNDEVTDSISWANGEDDHVVARAEYDFNAASDEEISFRAGDMLNLALKERQPKVRGWLLASLDGQTTGLIPANYVKILGKRRGRKTIESSKIPKQQQSFTNPALMKGVTTANSLHEQEAAFESVFAETSKVAGAPDSTGKNGEKQDL
ncbi:peroxisome biogenesis factor 13 isoform X2 [Mesocricetus auratus]|uniref:Peroxisomal membrane protein PEX13 n=1 Tax=Mesocricetus auratus TaxID=10036 RepID=A0ABM2WDY4_MESAU|nr:peroxisome biogenesis factor 13 isoform X2 [Mesocricetus auratus]